MLDGLGLDLVTISRIARLIDRYGDAFLDKIFTPSERAYCDAREPARAQHYAARFAAKEALLKALGVPSGLRWHELEVVHAAGRPELRLHGAASAVASRVGIRRVLLSLTHERDTAAAMVVTER